MRTRPWRFDSVEIILAFGSDVSVSVKIVDRQAVCQLKLRRRIQNLDEKRSHDREVEFLLAGIELP